MITRLRIIFFSGVILVGTVGCGQVNKPEVTAPISSWRVIESTKLQPAHWYPEDLGRNLSVPNRRFLEKVFSSSHQTKYVSAQFVKPRQVLLFDNNWVSRSGVALRGPRLLVEKPNYLGSVAVLKTPMGIFALAADLSEDLFSEVPKPTLLYKLHRGTWALVAESNFLLNADHPRMNWLRVGKAEIEILWALPDGFCRVRLGNNLSVPAIAKCDRDNSLGNSDAIILTNSNHSRAFFYDRVSASNVVATKREPSLRYRIHELKIN